MKVLMPITQSRLHSVAPCGMSHNLFSSVFSSSSKSNLYSGSKLKELPYEALKNQFVASQQISKITEKTSDLNNRIYILSGSSGVGKDTILKAFLEKHPDYHLSVSYTTRPMRNGEKNGKDYNFVSEDEFAKSIEQGEFLEWAEFSGNKYGTKKQALEQSLTDHKKIILKLDTIGALKVKKLLPEAILVFIAPPSIEELESRLRGRKTEDENAIKRRMSLIKSEMENSKLYDYTIVNDTVENAVASLEKIFKCKK